MNELMSVPDAAVDFACGPLLEVFALRANGKCTRHHGLLPSSVAESTLFEFTRWFDILAPFPLGDKHRDLATSIRHLLGGPLFIDTLLPSTSYPPKDWPELRGAVERIAVNTFEGRRILLYLILATGSDATLRSFCRFYRIDAETVASVRVLHLLDQGLVREAAAELAACTGTSLPMFDRILEVVYKLSGPRFLLNLLPSMASVALRLENDDRSLICNMIEEWMKLGRIDEAMHLVRHFEPLNLLPWLLDKDASLLLNYPFDAVEMAAIDRWFAEMAAPRPAKAVSFYLQFLYWHHRYHECLELWHRHGHGLPQLQPMMHSLERGLGILTVDPLQRIGSSPKPALSPRPMSRQRETRLSSPSSSPRIELSRPTSPSSPAEVKTPRKQRPAALLKRSPATSPPVPLLRLITTTPRHHPAHRPSRLAQVAAAFSASLSHSGSSAPVSPHVAKVSPTRRVIEELAEEMEEAILDTQPTSSPRRSSPRRSTVRKSSSPNKTSDVETSPVGRKVSPEKALSSPIKAVTSSPQKTPVKQTSPIKSPRKTPVKSPQRLPEDPQTSTRKTSPRVSPEKLGVRTSPRHSSVSSPNKPPAKKEARSPTQFETMSSAVKEDQKTPQKTSRTSPRLSPAIRTSPRHSLTSSPEKSPAKEAGSATKPRSVKEVQQKSPSPRKTPPKAKVNVRTSPKNPSVSSPEKSPAKKARTPPKRETKNFDESKKLRRKQQPPQVEEEKKKRKLKSADEVKKDNNSEKETRKLVKGSKKGSPSRKRLASQPETPKRSRVEEEVLTPLTMKFRETTEAARLAHLEAFRQLALRSSPRKNATPRKTSPSKTPKIRNTPLLGRKRQ